MADGVKMQIRVDYETKTLHLIFTGLTDHVSMDPETALRMVKEVEKRAHDLLGRKIITI